MEKVKNERILLLCWHNATQALPEVGKRVLCKLSNGHIAVGVCREDGYWNIDGLANYASREDVKWRYIAELDYDNLTLDDLEQMDLECIGCANGWWDGQPKEYLDAKAKGYKYYSVKVGSCRTKEYCPEGGFFYTTDSSD